MSTPQLSIPKSLNKAYRKVKPVRKDIDAFKANLINLLDNVKDTESEEFHKNLIIDFLKKTYYDPDHYVNTRGREDLVIYNGKSSDTTTGVLIEVKSPTNASEMLSIGKINTKALQELVLYYLRERVTYKNDEVRHIIVTNVHEWYIFDAQVFDKCFAQDSKLVKKFKEFESGALSDSKTSHFYKAIAQPAIEQYSEELEYTYVDLRKYEKPLRNQDLKDDKKLITLYKIFSPQHLLKQPFANDSNSLDKKFYDELLHIIGLQEEKVKGKKLIKRKKASDRDSASILENTITKLKTINAVNALPNRMQYGKDVDEQLFNLGLELVITWINRILFLKLLEAQLVGYHRSDKAYRFLNMEMIANYDQLFTLFHEVLAIDIPKRDGDIADKYSKVPYLNSSLFEIQPLERSAIMINQLKDDLELPIHGKTVLKDNSKKRTGKQNTLAYLFDFLDAYDFSSEGGEDIQEDNKNLINASVLGLIFEKINGYKDGSFFTPGFITMYMCRETIRRAVVQKFNDHKGWEVIEFDQLYNKIEDKKEANDIINSLKICDPAVGSGHFLVSALNEIMSIKSDLKVLQDDKGKTLRDYELDVVNDELVITVDDELFEYHPDNKEASRVQKTLFHEKQTIIENCLFGVDINPNSVKICQLRLWVELLKHAYYNDAKQLETLPNIDINIKCGNSLISRFALDADMSDVFTKKGYSQSEYLHAVSAYKDAPDKEAKAQLRDYLAKIKLEFHTNLYARDPRKKKLSGWRGQLNLLENKEQLGDLFEKISDKKVTSKIAKLQKDITKLEQELQDEEDGRFYEINNAFERRFEFPEVLQEDGGYRGFDVVIGNPPYIRQEEFKEIKEYLMPNFVTYAGTADLFVYFVEQGLRIAKDGAQFVYILPNKWMRAGYGSKMRDWVAQYDIDKIIDFGDLPVFEEATTYPCIWQIAKSEDNKKTFTAANLDTLEYDTGLSDHIAQVRFTVNQNLLSPSGWSLVDDKTQNLLEKIKSAGVPLGEYVDGKIYYGIKTGLNEAFVIDEATKDRLIAEDPKSAEVIKPFLAGRDIKRYETPKVSRYLILFKNGDTRSWFGNLLKADALAKIREKYPAIINWLLPFQEKAIKRTDQGEYWWELRACAYYDEFEEEKIMYQIFQVRSLFIYDSSSVYCNNSMYIIPSSNRTVLAILNSSLGWFLINQYCTRIQNGVQLIYRYFENVPIFNKRNEKLEKLTLEIEGIETSNEERSHLESQIDLMVYKLYGLTYDEVLMVEASVGDGSFGVSEVEYLKFEK